MSTVLAGTGHRPARLGLDYSPRSNEILTDFVRSILSFLHREAEITEVISGFAQGFDQALAHAAILLKIPVIAAIPFEGQDSKWPAKGQQRYQALLRKAKEVHVISKGGFSSERFLIRDEWMVDRALAAGGHLIAMYDGVSKGGTAHTVGFAKSQGLGVIDLWPLWQQAGVSSGETIVSPGVLKWPRKSNSKS